MRWASINELADHLGIKIADIRILIKHFKFPDEVGIRSKEGKQERIWSMSQVAHWIEDQENEKELKVIQKVRKRQKEKEEKKERCRNY